ncbi:YdcF family protein [Acinetobacter sp. YH12239]|uniref:YdcF family protein n=1 Tax=Acinetobacter sp. YH12239 TaxID=2601166 RepID=UPI0015D3C42E|nr:YdcF family protein [Acinetobacter sp. YH12239]
MSRKHWMVTTVRMMAIIFALLGCLMVFWYTPFYSALVVKSLHAFVPIKVDEIAAKSQQMAALTDKEDLEPGSRLWIARQAYLKLIEEQLNDQGADQLAEIQTRYVLLKQKIKDELLTDVNKKNETKEDVVFAIDQPDLASDVAISQTDSTNSSINEEKNQRLALMEKYEFFLRNHPLEEDEVQKLDPQIYKDIALIQNENKTLSNQKDKPYAIVVLGGGLTLGDNKIDIVVNDYTRSRLEKTLEIEKQTDLPIVLSGVEAPYMQAWLASRGVEANLLEQRSMNTCENTRFSSLLLQKKGGAPTVILITDRYHMTRTRRLFALNGIKTIPVEAPMPTMLTTWRPSQLNYDHSRRANYELLATIRDVMFGSSGCREVP